MATRSDPRVRVYCRVRPLLEQGPQSGVRVQGGEVSVGDSSFVFDSVFDELSTQEAVFQNLRCSELVNDVLRGYNATIFAYGQTGSGKTYTMEGTRERPGLVPRAATALFEGVADADSSLEFTIKATFVEIYMERIRDLLDNYGAKSCSIRENGDGVYVSGCTETFVTDEAELLDVMHQGQGIRATAATGMNEGSSRSHSVLTLTVSCRSLETESRRTGKLVLVDLAGSEMVRKTGATGQQLEEAKTINKSLSALGQVITALTDDSKTHVPYRDSKLTRMLQDSLGGNAKTVLIINISMASSNATETLSTLRFGHRAKRVKNSPKVNERKSVDELTALLHKAEAAIDMQASYIAALERRGGANDETSRTILELREKIARLTEELEEEKHENSQRKSEVQHLTAVLGDKERLLTESDDLLNRAQTKLDKATEEVTTLRDLRDTQQFQIKELELQLETLKSVKEIGGDVDDRESVGISPTTDHQRERLVADLRQATDRLKECEHEKLPDDAKERAHALSLTRRLEQLVAVHRQLLRKYATLELNLAEAAKKIALRDERIARFEADRARPSSIEQDCNDSFSTLLAKIHDLDKKVTMHKASTKTVRGGHQPVAPVQETPKWW